MKRTPAFFWLLLLAFSPCFYFSFVYHNDLGFWVDSGWLPHLESGHLILFARPIGAILLDLQTNFLRLFPFVSVLNIFRFFSFLSLIGMLFLLRQIARIHTALTETQIQIMLLTLALQPAWLESVFWVTAYVPSLFSYICALGAAVLFDPASSGKSQPSLRRIIVAALLVVISFLCYPVGTCSFFWSSLLFVCFRQASLSNRQTFALVLRAVVFFALTCSLALILDRFLLKDLACTHWTVCRTWIPADSTEYSTQLILDPWSKLNTLLSLLKLSTASWFPLWQTLDIFTSLPGVALLIFAFVPTDRTGRNVVWKLSSWGVAFFWFFSFLILLNSPNLITRGAVVAFRTTAPNSILLAIGALKTLRLISGTRAWTMRFNIMAASLISILVVSCFLSACRFLSHYEIGWESVAKDSEVQQICRTVPRNTSNLISVPIIHLFMKNDFFPGINGSDYNLPFLLEAYLPGICPLLSNSK